MHDRTLVARQISRGLFDAAALIDERQGILEFNDAFAQLAGMNRRRVQKRIDDGARLFDLFGTEGNAAVVENFRAAWESRQPIRMAEIPLRAGNVVMTAWIAFIPIVDEDARCVAIQVVLRDVTAEARMQDHFRQLLGESQARADELEQKVAARTTELQGLLQEVTRLARVDPLTGLLNRRAFTEFATQALAIARRNNRIVALLMCDLDFFKRVNDSFGHAAGDAILVGTAQALATRLRSTDRVARLGGEEFVVLLTETERGVVLEVGDRCCASVRQLPFAELVPGKDTPQTISIGAAIFPAHGDTLDALLRRADEALYRAKEEGRDRVVMAR